MITDPQKNISEMGFVPGQKVADFGSGAGHYTYALSKILGSDGLVIAVDVKKEVLTSLKNQAIREGINNIEVVWGDIEKLGGTGLKSSSVDGVILSNILFQLTDKTGAINEASRILIPGGKLGIVEWSELSFINGIKNEGEKMIVTIDSAVQLIESLGFKKEKTFEAGDHHYGLIFKKN
jgi:ubiquinone/menaquinone biosynthesis C-methylase UbiE